MNTGRKKKTDGVSDEGESDEVICIKIPWKGIALAFFLSFTGLLLLCFGILTALGYLDQKYEDRILSFFMLGALMFIPGSYHMFVAYCAYTKKYGYSYHDIPDLD